MTHCTRLLTIFILLPAAAAAQIDREATPETRALYHSLKDQSGKSCLFGHQDDLAYGYRWKSGTLRSDVKEVTGCYPGLFGWDFGHLELPDVSQNLDGVHRDSIRNWIRFGNRIGSVITLSWHIQNPAEGTAAVAGKTAVETLLPGGENHALMKDRLDRLAGFLASLTDDAGKPVPVIFRPWHEHNGDWFWWGKGRCTPDQYRDLWQFTVRYLRDEKAIHHLLYAISPDRSRMQPDSFRAGYLYAWPGDDFVDILGFDNYWDVGHPAYQIPEEQKEVFFSRTLTELSVLAAEKGKVAALTETGNETIKKPDWFTGTLLKGLTSTVESRQIAYVMVWRNRTASPDLPDHYYTPHAGHPAAADFIRFREDPYIRFAGEN